MADASSTDTANIIAQQANTIAMHSLCASVVYTILTALLLIITGISVFCAYKAYRHQKQRALKDAACELAKFYAQDVIEKFLFVSHVLQTSGLSDEIEKAISYKSLDKFDRKEIEPLLNEKGYEYEKFLNRMCHIDPETIIRAKMKVATSISEIAELQEQIEQLSSKTPAQIKEISLSLNSQFTVQSTMLLNSLEYFAIRCNYKLADEKILFQSLHKTFLSYMVMFSPFICFSNGKSDCKLYVNAIDLFRLWRDRYASMQADIEKQKDLVKKQKELAEQLAKDAAEKEGSVDPPVFSGTKLQ